jgi:hypothetical protein
VEASPDGDEDGTPFGGGEVRVLHGGASRPGEDRSLI